MTNGLSKNNLTHADIYSSPESKLVKKFSHLTDPYMATWRSKFCTLTHRATRIDSRVKSVNVFKLELVD